MLAIDQQAFQALDFLVGFPSFAGALHVLDRMRKSVTFYGLASMDLTVSNGVSISFYKVLGLRFGQSKAQGRGSFGMIIEVKDFMKKMILIAPALLIAPLLLQAAPKCGDSFPVHAQSSRSIHPKVAKAIELLEGGQSLRAAYKVIANMRLSLRDAKKDIPQRPDLVTELSPLEKTALLEALEANYEIFSVKMQVLVIELYQLAGFELNQHSIDLWADAYVRKLESAPQQTHALHLAGPLQSFSLMREVVPESMLEAIQDRVIATEADLIYKPSQVAQILRSFKSNGFVYSHAFGEVIDNIAQGELREARLNYRETGDLNVFSIVQMVRQMQISKVRLSSDFQHEWSLIVDSLQREVHGAGKLESSLDKAISEMIGVRLGSQERGHRPEVHREDYVRELDEVVEDGIDFVDPRVLDNFGPEWDS